MGFEKELKDLYTFQKAADAKQAAAAAAPATGPSHARDRQIRQGGYGRALRRLSASTVVAAMTSACGNAQSVAPPHSVEEAKPNQPIPNEYAVSWHPTLLEFVAPRGPALEQQSDLNARFDQTWEDVLQLRDGQRTVEARTCRTLLDLDISTYETVVPSELYVYQARFAECRAAALLIRARPSKASFLHGFALDAQAPNRLPAALVFFVSPDDEDRVTQASARGEPWSAVEDVHWVSQAATGETRYQTNDAEQELTIVGQGDINGDGFEDLLLLSRGRLTAGTLKNIVVYALTQESANEPTMRILSLD
ncbi:MAG TPA: hypothetical protein VNN80_27400 [Polyangiaceae bacterium]|nr:hypothetical protein [Polyangiaceae bacterium]